MRDRLYSMKKEEEKEGKENGREKENGGNENIEAQTTSRDRLVLILFQ